MTSWITLLRGVNVGGHNKLPMAEFRAALTEAGFDNVSTYIQSGNVVFRTKLNRQDITRVVTAVLDETFDIQVRTFVMELAQLQNAIAANPYPNAAQDPKTLHLFFLSEEQVNLNAAGLADLATKGEEFALLGRVFYLYTPNGFGRSNLAAKMARFFSGTTTARNLRSCLRIAELAQGS